MVNSQFLKKLINIFLHASVWILLLLFFYITDAELDEDNIVSLINLPLFIVPYLGLFYFNSLFNIKRYLLTKQLRKYFALLLISIAVLLTIVSFLDYWEYLNCCTSEEPFSLEYTVLDNFFFSLFVLGLSFSYSFLIIWMKSEKLKKESELKLLKSQMNPHFLFNSLNTLYALVSEKEVEKAEDAILKLSDILRYSVYQVNDPKIALKDEINCIKNYIALQELRLDGKVNISFHCQGEMSKVSIEPMLLIPFVENAFKHGVSYTQPSKIDIELRLNKEEITFKVINTINDKPKKMDEFSGVGIKNVVDRLKLLYPGHHKLEIDRKNGLHQVFLLIIT